MELLDKHGKANINSLRFKLNKPEREFDGVRFATAAESHCSARQSYALPRNTFSN